jgi:hypothetical protein
MVLLWLAIWFALLIISLKGAEYLLKKTDQL